VAVLAEVWSVMLELSPWLLLGALVAGLLHGLLPPGFVQRQLRGRSGVLKAVALGVPLPLCSCGVIPAGLGLKQDGASDGAAIGFLTATPQTGVDSMLVSASFLGWPFALWKVGAALITGVVSGALTDAAVGSSAVPVAAPRQAGGPRPGPRAMLDHSVDMIRMIWRWLVFGVVVSALISTFLPADAFAGLSGAGTVASFAAVLLISVPLYVCATASVPIAAALVAAGLPTGAALVFLMAGPATNVATLGAVWRGFGRRAVAVYLGTIIVGSVAFGLLYEAVVGPLVGSTGRVHDHTTWWATAAALVLTGMLAWFAGEDARAWIARRRMVMAGSPDRVAPQPPREIAVGGMTCNGCASRLERVLLKTEGVTGATVSFDDGRAVVAGAATAAAVRAAIEGAGFDVL
jgi:uncharacterized membrane protein YraQ (UPF0718 family)/copper chaperone CopZ